MKFLHLSDLHIGKSVNGFPMLEEQRHVFWQIIEYIQKEKPDAVIIAGDVYDRAVPGAEAVRLFDDFLTDLANEDVTILLISGNHDSPERLHFASRLLADRKLHLCGVFDGKLHSVTVSDEFGGVNFWLLPFIRPSAVRGMFGDKQIESYTDAISAVLEATEIDHTGRNVLVSHQFYTAMGVTPIRSESEMNPVGGLDAVDAGIVSQFDYVALGHLHGAQPVCHTIRYAGSPIKYSFSECRQKKSITLVEIKAKGDIAISTLPLTPLHDMRDIKGTLDQLLSDGLCAKDGKEDYLRVTLTDEEELIDPMGKIRSVYPNVMVLDFENARHNVQLSGAAIDSSKVEEQSPYDLFSEFFLEMNGAVMNETQAKIVRELMETEAGQ